MSAAAKAIVADCRASFKREPVPYAVLMPPGYQAAEVYPLCIVLHGGGGSHQNLIEVQPLLEQWWAEGALPPMVFAAPGTGALSYYLDRPDGSERWESFIVGEFLSEIHSRYNVRREREGTLISGISMGGYGALKIAFANAGRFAAVAAIQPLLEPGLNDSDIGGAQPDASSGWRAAGIDRADA